MPLQLEENMTSEELSDNEPLITTASPIRTFFPSDEKQTSELNDLDSMSKTFHGENNRDMMRKRDLRGRIEDESYRDYEKK